MKNREEQIAAVGLLVLFTLFVFGSAVPEVGAVEFSEELAGAVEELKRGNYDRAVGVLSDYPSEGPLATYARYLLARSYLGRGSPGDGLGVLEGIEADGPGGVTRFERYYLEAKALHELGRNGRAAEVAEEASEYAETTEENEKLLELRLSVARDRGRPQRAFETAVALIEASNLRFIGTKRDRLFDLTEELSRGLEYSSEETRSALISFIETLVRYREYRRARRLLLRHMGDLSGDLKTRAYFRLAWLDGFKLDFPEEALWTFQRFFGSESGRSLEAKGRYYFVLLKNEIEEGYDLVENLLRINEEYPETYFGKLAAERALEEETEEGDLTGLDEGLERYRDRLSRSAVRNATWRLFFQSYGEDRYELALDYLGLLESYYDATPPGLFFWRRKTKIASPELEPGSYLDAAAFRREYPVNYYSLLAGEKGWSRGSFRVNETWSRRELGLDRVEERLLEATSSSAVTARFEEAVGLKEHGLLRPALNRLERLSSELPEQDFLYLKSRWERSAGNYRESLKAAKELMGRYYEGNRRPPVEVVRAAYPTYFSNEVARAAGKFGLPEELVYAVIRQESAFDRDAYSTAKAGGLTQVIPSTAAGIAEDLGVEDFRFEDLFEPGTAVEFGSYYVDKQISASGDVRLGLVAYHGGAGNLSRWREEYGTEDVDLFLERVPLESTKSYAKAVYRNYLMYRHLY